MDRFRTLDQRAEQYTWWNNRKCLRQQRGWRLDIRSLPGIAATAKKAQIYLKRSSPTAAADH